MQRPLRAIVVPPADEVVDDSEPEREQRRQEERARRRTRRKLDHPKANNSIITLDSDSNAASNNNRRAISLQDHTIIDITDSTDDEISRVPAGLDVAFKEPSARPSPVSSGQSAHNSLSADTTRLPTVQELLAIHRSKPSSIPSAASSVASAEPPPPTATTNTTQPAETIPDDDPESPVKGTRLLNIARFAYTDTRRSMSRASSSAPSRATPLPAPPAPPRPRRGAPDAAAAALAAFSDADIGALRKCPCCDAVWTARKTAPQKLKHVRSCARKLGLADDTLAPLVRAELRRVAALATAEAQAQAALPAADAPGTLLETAIDGGARKKSGRRPQVVETVRELHETRQDILDRARLLLGEGTTGGSMRRQIADDVPGPSSGSPPRTQPFSESRLAGIYRPTAFLNPTQPEIYVPDDPAPRDEAIAGPSNIKSPPRTQPFGESALARKYGRARAVPDPSVHEPSSPPRTQPFGESALAKRFGTTRAVDLLDDTADPFGPGSPPRHVFHEVSNSSPRRAASDDADVALPDAAPPHNPTVPPVRRDSSSALGPWLPSMPPSPLHSPLRLAPSPPAPGPPSPRLPADDDDGAVWRMDDGFGYEQEYGYENEYYWGSEGQDDAILRYEPGDEYEYGVPDREAETGEPPTAEPRSPARRRTRSRSTSPSVPLGATASAQTKDKSKPRKKAAAKGRGRGKARAGYDDDDEAGDAPDAPDDAALHAQLRARIVQDTALYSRILRYEPIHFDVFVQLAEATGAPARGLKLRVRDFLDAQAIHFYGHDATTARTKRRK